MVSTMTSKSPSIKVVGNARVNVDSSNEIKIDRVEVEVLKINSEETTKFKSFNFC